MEGKAELLQLLKLCPNLQALKLKLRDHPAYKPQEKLPFYVKLDHLRVLSLKDSLILSKESSQQLDNYFSALESLSVIGANQINLNSHLTNLTNLSIGDADCDANSYPSNEFFSTNIHPLNRILSLKILQPEPLGQIELETIFPNLKTLKIEDLKDTCQLISIPPNLEHLRVVGCISSFDEILKELPIKGKQLKSLGLEEMGFNSKLESGINFCTQLIALSLEGTVEASKVIPKMRMPNLEYINLNSTDLNDFRLGVLLSKQPKLKVLKIIDNFEISELGVKEAKTLAPYIEYFAYNSEYS
jgi:hypothetical protein